jgi:hypothetical protein
LINRMRDQQEDGTPARTIREQAEGEGAKLLVHNFVNNYTKFFDRNRGRQESCHNPIFYHIITYMEEAYELPEKAPYYSH